MASSFRELLGVPASTASPSDSALIIIDAQNEYAAGKLAVTNAPQSRRVIASLLEKYRAAAPKEAKIVHVLHKVPDGAPIFTPDTDLSREFEEVAAKVSQDKFYSFSCVPRWFWLVGSSRGAKLKKKLKIKTRPKQKQAKHITQRSTHVFFCK